MNSTRLTLQQLRQPDQKKHVATPMLTCYDYTTARLLSAAGVRAFLVGDSAANVILGYDSTLPISLEFLIELTAAVRRGAPDALVIGDLPFGSYSTRQQALKSAASMVKRSGCDAIKLETGRGHIGHVQSLADNGVAVVAHLGLRPQSVKLLGGYKSQGKTADEVMRIVDLAHDLVVAGAAAVLLEAVPGEVAELLAQLVEVPIIGCGAGPSCHSHVVVLNDILGLSDVTPRFAPKLADMASPLQLAARKFIKDIQSRHYPSAEQSYLLSPEQRAELETEIEQWGLSLSSFSPIKVRPAKAKQERAK